MWVRYSETEPFIASSLCCNPGQDIQPIGNSSFKYIQII